MRSSDDEAPSNKRSHACRLISIACRKEKNFSNLALRQVFLAYPKSCLLSNLSSVDHYLIGLKRDKIPRQQNTGSALLALGHFGGLQLACNDFERKDCTMRKGRSLNKAGRMLLKRRILGGIFAEREDLNSIPTITYSHMEAKRSGCTLSRDVSATDTYVHTDRTLV